MISAQYTLRIPRAVILTSRWAANNRLYSSTKEYNQARNPEKVDQAALHRRPNHKSSRGVSSGNPEGVGFVDQVGSQSATANRLQGDKTVASREGFTGQEDITPPSFVDAVKNKLGMKTTTGKAKQNRGNGAGVTGTGTARTDTAKRTLWTSAVNGMPASDRLTLGQAPDGSREPKERTNAEQNPHLKHKASTSIPDSGNGNAAPEPTLPSHKFSDKKSRKSPSVQRSRTFSTSTQVAADNDAKHTAETYFKDIDSSPPPSSKTHQVDGSGTGAQIQRPNEALSGDSAVGKKEYQTVDKDHPYDAPPSSEQESDQILSYGGTKNAKDSGEKKDASDGPEGASKEGRKPEGKA
ncbi:hypothetical protein QCA50_000755 [Cerrena zonata]|uniref:Uncharacterized protein n=1 Tax=Cerrena zonata TaxID=2478898 RepID=A0AAW0GTS3_9APHY